MSDKWPPNEQAVIERWDEITPDNVYYIEEIPVGVEQVGDLVKRARSCST
jgi:hypothetical protein